MPLTLPEQHTETRPTAAANSTSTLQHTANLLPRFIKAEANLLRLPLFALGTKGLRNLDAIECRGTIRRNGETHQFTFQAARNAKTHYPGPLSRAAHQAFLSIATDRGFPIDNPISWSWRDLCRRMGLQPSGREVRQIKAAITATAGLLIRSHFALYSKADRQPIRTSEDALHLYERVTFVGSPLPDGTIADANYLWLSQWYIQNLNAMFTAPLDYELWRFLDKRSPIASRLYEWLLLNFYSGTPQLRINYETLAQYLPVHPEPYLSLAKKQLAPALHLVSSVEVVTAATWSPSKTGIAALLIERGQKLTPPFRRPLQALDMAHDQFTDDIQVRELRHTNSVEHQLVSEFYRLWTGNDKKPTAKEMSLAKQLVERHETPKARAIVREAVKEMKHCWPDAKSFGGITKYLDEAIRQVEKEEYRRSHELKHAQTEAREQAEQERREIELLKFKPLWNTLPESQRHQFRQAVSAKNPHMVRFPKLIERFALTEFACTRGAILGPPADAA